MTTEKKSYASSNGMSLIAVQCAQISHLSSPDHCARNFNFKFREKKLLGGGGV
jgi:hypothetical protein